MFLTNPTSPAGLIIPEEIMEKALYLAEKNDSWLALDEAFIDFTDAPGLAGKVKEHPRLLVLHSLTKIFSLPGLRLGYMTVPPALSNSFWKIVEPWSLNVLALAAGSYCLDQEEFMARTRMAVEGQRNWLMENLGFLGKVIPGKANYLTIKLEAPGWTVPKLAGELRKHGILIRDCASFQGILKGYFRVAVKSGDQNRLLVETAKRIISGGYNGFDSKCG